MTLSQLQSNIEKSASLDFSSIFSRSIDLFKKVWVQGFVHLILGYVVTLGISFVFYLLMLLVAIPFGISLNLTEMAAYPEAWAASIGITGIIVFIALYIILIMLSTGVFLGIFAHFFCTLREVDQGNVETSEYFKFLKRPYLFKLAKLGLAIFGITMLASLACGLPLFYVIVPIAMMLPVFAFNPDLSVRELISIAFKVGNKHWFTIFITLSIFGLITVVATLFTCGLGALFLTPLTYIPLYYIYKDTIGIEETGISDDDIHAM